MNHRMHLIEQDVQTLGAGFTGSASVIKFHKTDHGLIGQVSGSGDAFFRRAVA